MVSDSPHLQRPVYYLLFQVFGKSHAAEGARLCNTLYTKQAYLRRLKLSKLKNYVSLSYRNGGMTMPFYQKFLWIS